MAAQLLRQRAYEKIRHAIVSLRFEMGKTLNEKEVCSQLRIGRTPVREALQKLEREGLVVVVPRKGAFVSPVTLDDFRKLFEARNMLETYCVRAAVERISDEQIDLLRSLLSGNEDLIVKRDIDALLDIDRKFHMGIVQCLDNRYIEQVANQIYDKVTRLWYLSFTSRTEDELKFSASSHLEILEALATRDPDLALSANQRHLENFAQQIYKHSLGSSVKLVSNR